MLKRILLAAAIAASFGTISAPVLARDIIVQVAPPAPRQETVPQARRGQVWAPGHWEWNGRRYVWAQGHFVRERRGYAYHEPRWEERNGKWHYSAGNWRRGDRDGDGVRNGNDRAPNNPNKS